MATVRIKRDFAVWLQDCLHVELPENVDANDPEVQAAVRDAYDDLFGAVCSAADHGEPTTTSYEHDTLGWLVVSLQWEDELVTSVETLDDTWVVEAVG